MPDRDILRIGRLAKLAAWILLVSPAGQQATPMSKWNRAGTYQTQSSCEYERTLQSSGAHLMFPNRGEIEKAEPHKIVQGLSSECVSEDDERLK